MKDAQVPVTLPGLHESLFAGFWARFGSILLDGLIFTPVTIFILVAQNFGQTGYLIGGLTSLLLYVILYIYVAGKYGGTPGKLICGIKIIRMDGEDISYSEAAKRSGVQLAISFLAQIMLFSAVYSMTPEEYDALSWAEKSVAITQVYPTLHLLHLIIANIWIWGELIVLLTNDRKRALHDYMANTVVVQTKYIPYIRQYIQTTGNTENHPTLEQE